MIGHWLLSLTPEQEDRILQRRLNSSVVAAEQNFYNPTRNEWCVLGAAYDVHDWNTLAVAVRPQFYRTISTYGYRLSPGNRYFYLRHRFGPTRINDAIRNRILANQARRVLQSETVAA